jgi:ABC-type glycerol-3-phosphate transport system permease component
MVNNRTRRIRYINTGDKVFLLILNAFLIMVTALVLYPLIYVLSSSFSSTDAVIAGKVVLWPVEPTLDGYRAVFVNDRVLMGYGNSIIYAAAGTAVNVIMTVLAAYPLSRKYFYGRGFFMFLFTFTMLFSGGMVPLYLLVNKLNLYDTRLAMIIPTALGVYQVIIARTYFKSTIPDELYEASQLDGANELRFIWKIVIPLSTPIVAVLVLMYAVQHWNSYFHALIFLRSFELYPLQIILRDILIQNAFEVEMISDTKEMMQKQGMQDLLKYSLIVVASVPVLAIYPFVQKYFVKGIMIGSLKG